MTLRDLQWKAAHVAWIPGGLICELEENFERKFIEERNLQNMDRVLVRLGFVKYPRYIRVLTVLITVPSSWLSEKIFPNWAEDERSHWSYWKKK